MRSPAEPRGGWGVGKEEVGCRPAQNHQGSPARPALRRVRVTTGSDRRARGWKAGNGPPTAGARVTPPGAWLSLTQLSLDRELGKNHSLSRVQGKDSLGPSQNDSNLYPPHLPAEHAGTVVRLRVPHAQGRCIMGAFAGLREGSLLFLCPTLWAGTNAPFYYAHRGKSCEVPSREKGKECPQTSHTEGAGILEKYRENIQA